MLGTASVAISAMSATTMRTSMSVKPLCRVIRSNVRVRPGSARLAVPSVRADLVLVAVALVDELVVPAVLGQVPARDETVRGIVRTGLSARRLVDERVQSLVGRRISSADPA